jgi:quinol monooxygenase YgiN
MEEKPSGMNAVMIHMTARPGKQMELLQAFTGLAAQIRQDERCTGLFFTQDVEHEDCFLFLEQWQTRQDMEAHFRTELFTVLLGGIHVLCTPPEIVVQTIVASEGKEAIESARKRR